MGKCHQKMVNARLFFTVDVIVDLPHLVRGLAAKAHFHAIAKSVHALSPCKANLRSPLSQKQYHIHKADYFLFTIIFTYSAIEMLFRRNKGGKLSQ